MKRKLLVTLGGSLALLAHTAGVFALFDANEVPNALVMLAVVGAILGAAVGFATKRVEMAVTMILCGLFLAWTPETPNASPLGWRDPRFIS